LCIRQPTIFTLFPYTTLFRSDSLEILLDKVLDMNLKTGLDVMVNEVLSGKEPVLNDLEEVIISKDTKYIEKKLRKVIGRGKGLTDRKSTRLNSSHVSISYAVF